MAQNLALLLGLMIAAGGGEDRRPPTPQGEYEQVRGPDFSLARQLNREGKREKSAAILRKLVADPQWEVRARAILVIGELRERSLLPELNRAIKDPMLFVRERATRVLQTMGNASSLGPLREALSEPDAAVRGNIAEALARIGGARELPTLRKILQHDADEDVRARTAAALGDARVAAAVDPLISSLGDASVSVRARAAEALGEIEDSRARSALENVARSDPDTGVRQSAASALRRLVGGEPGKNFR